MLVIVGLKGLRLVSGTDGVWGHGGTFDYLSNIGIVSTVAES